MNSTKRVEVCREGENPAPFYSGILNQAEKAALITAAGPRIEMLEGFEMLTLLRDKLQHLHTDISVVFSKLGAGTVSDAQALLGSQNPGIVLLKHQFADKFHLFWVPRDLRMGLVVVDDLHTLVEHPDRIFASQVPLAVAYRHQPLACFWTRRFNIIRDRLSSEVFATTPPLLTNVS